MAPTILGGALGLVVGAIVGLILGGTAAAIVVGVAGVVIGGYVGRARSKVRRDLMSGREPIRIGVRGVVAVVAVAAAVIAGCSDGSTPPPRAAASATTSTIDTASTTAVASATTSTTDTAAAPAAAPATTTASETAAADTGAGSASLEPLRAEADVGDIGAGTLWREVFGTFTASEQSCVGEAMSDARLETLLQGRVLEGSEVAELPVAAMFACLRPETSDAIWASVVITAMAREELEDLELGSTERSCMRELLAGLVSGEDLAALITQDDSEMSDDELAMALRTTAVLFQCVPDYFIQTTLSEAGVDPDELDELSADEASCLRELATGLDDLNWLEISAASVSEENYGLLFETIERTGLAVRATVLFECVPDFFIQMTLSGTGIDPEDLSDDEISCLRGLATDLGDLDWPGVSAASVSEENYGLLFETFFEMMQTVPECLPERSLSSLWRP
ncbi:MAG: hypothetical protein OXC00_14450 [Acidimicrobiaceae bacterium]|nr:hypothetical protein [Acidimicrobiaceae bacterium]